MSTIQSTGALYNLLSDENITSPRNVDLILQLIPKANINALVYNAHEGTLIFDEEPSRRDELQSLFHMFLQGPYARLMLHSDYTARCVERIHAEFLKNGAKLPNAHICNRILRGWAETIEDSENLLEMFKETYQLYDTKCRKVATNTIKRYDATHRYIDDSLHRMYHPKGKLAQNLWGDVERVNESLEYDSDY